MKPLFVWPLALTVGVILAACASDNGHHGTRPPGALATATSLGEKDARLSGLLRARAAGEGWEKEGDAWTSPGWRGAGDKRWSELGSRLPLRASGVLEVGVSTFAALRVRLVPRDAEGVDGTLRDGHLVYAGAYGANVDVVMTTTRESVEELFVVRDPSARTSFAWDVELPSGIARAAMGGDGALRFEDKTGERVFGMPAPYAVDARGVKRMARLSWDDRSRRLGLDLDASGLTFPVLLDPAFEVGLWDKVQAPPSRYSPALAYDASRGRAVLFGGSGVGGQLNDTWTWDGTTWTQALPAQSPPVRMYHAMVYDAARRRTVLFGGFGAGGMLNDTWLWDGTTWTQATAGTAPPARTDHRLAFDAARGRVVLFGGGSGVGELADTWTWDGTVWTQASPATSPPRRTGHALAYDELRGRVVLFGGSSNGRLADTWTWDGTTWAHPLPAASPPARFYHVMAYDAARGRVVVHGGSGASGQLTDTWTWNGTTWANALPATSPPTRDYGAMTYDASRGRVVLFGGNGGGGSNLNDTWLWDGTTWGTASPASSPPARGSHALAYDGTRNRTVLFGGFGLNTYLGDTWTWQGMTWTQAAPATSPPVRANHVLAYDASRAQVLLFGGDGGSAYLNDTWTWNGTTWTHLFPATSPPVRSLSGMAYDAMRDRVVLFGGSVSTIGESNDTWTWNGTTWANALPATLPPARIAHALAYDPLRGRVVLFGGFAGNGYVNDTWTWNGTTWALASPATSPPPRGFHALTFDATRGRVVLFGGTSNGGRLNDTWTWDGTTWTSVSPASSPPARDYPALAYDTSRSRVVLFGGTTGINGTSANDTWLYHTRGGACAAAADCGSGFCVDGVCCEASSCGSCQACNGASQPGICTSVTSAADPDSCPGSQACDASGACKPSLGQACTTGGQCASGICTDGECCDSACTGTCQACTAALKVSGTDGACGLAKVGVDPHNDCPQDGLFSCQRDGQCDGTGRCRIYSQGTSCGPSTCAQNRATGRVCDGIGACVLSAAGVDCSPYACNPGVGGCSNPCAGDDECVLGNYCDAGACKPRLAPGAACASAAACPAGTFCADGVCCNTPCKGQCEACNSTDAPGSCIPIQGAPHAGRAACTAPEGDVCAASSCDGTNRAACSGFVGPTESCRAASCTAGTATLAATCTGKGKCQDLATTTCTPYVCAGTACGTSCAADAECDAQFRCETASHKCVSRNAASCDGDHLLVAPDGTSTDCAPYKCEGTGCKASCASIRECAYPNECSGDSHTCVAPLPGAAPNTESGCAVAKGVGEGEGSTTGWPFAAGVAVLFALRRKRAQSQRVYPAAPKCDRLGPT